MSRWPISVGALALAVMAAVGEEGQAQLGVGVMLEASFWADRRSGGKGRSNGPVIGITVHPPAQQMAFLLRRLQSYKALRQAANNKTLTAKACSH